VNTHDIAALLPDLAELLISPNMTEEDAAKSMRFLGPFNQCVLGIVYFSGETPWERHPGGDELLYVLDGEVSLTILTDGEPERATVNAGSIFVVPKGLWHRQFTQSGSKVLFATPTEGNENSWAVDPRRDVDAA
jgi:mannose-6-phosphate isomerase-like protein (cupin superfamily)